MKVFQILIDKIPGTNRLCLRSRDNFLKKTQLYSKLDAET